MAATKLNASNFPEGITLWVSNKCTSEKSGKDTYWCSIDEYEDGIVLYLCRSVWEHLPQVNHQTVLDELLSGSYEITEAHSLETGELLYNKDGEQIFQVSKARETVHGKFKA